MKKDIGFLMFIVILSGSLIFLPSCSMKISNPVEPEVDTCSEDVIANCGLIELIESGEISIKPLNPGYGHFLQFLLEGIYEGYVEFTNDKYVKPYINKVEAVLKMIEVNNFKGALKKLTHDISKNTTDWICDSKVQFIIYDLLYLTRYMLLNPEEDYYTFDPELSWEELINPVELLGDPISIVVVLIGVGVCLGIMYGLVGGNCVVCSRCYRNCDARKNNGEFLTNESAYWNCRDNCHNSSACQNCYN